MGKVVKGKDAPEKSGPAVGYAAGLKRLERNRARREQRAKAKRAKQRAAAKKLGVPSPVPDEIPLPPTFDNVLSIPRVAEPTNGCATDSATKPYEDVADLRYGGEIHGRPLRDPDLRIGRRSPSQYDGTIVYDVMIVRATDNARTVVRGLGRESAEALMVELAKYQNHDLVSVERTTRREY